MVHVFFLTNSTVPKITADDLAQLNHVAVFSFNLMSVRMQVADNDLFSHSRLVCLKRDSFIWTVTFMLSATGVLLDWIKNKAAEWVELKMEQRDI